ncbi:hypothetical protein AHF37_03938 [Paragonimus kellicotti]|nr:hypothetical protein AHF37_03938 [Paragonimus kellicotti]
MSDLRFIRVIGKCEHLICMDQLGDMSFCFGLANNVSVSFLGFGCYDLPPKLYSSTCSQRASITNFPSVLRRNVDRFEFTDIVNC